MLQRAENDGLPLSSSSAFFFAPDASVLKRIRLRNQLYASRRVHWQFFTIIFPNTLFYFRNIIRFDNVNIILNRTRFLPTHTSTEEKALLNRGG